MDTQKSHYRLNLLGGFKLLDGQGQEVRITGKKAQALLAYLALTSGREHSRESLATLLWGDRQDEQARQSLRQSISELRKALGGNGDALQVEGDVVSVSGLAVDALTFGQLLERDSNGSLEEAAGLYAGPLLEESRLESEGFNAWLTGERERLHGLACGALVRLAGDKEQAGDAEGAMEAAKRLLVLDPVQEEGHRLLMRIHSADGRRTDALRQYQTCAEALRRELDAEPSEATRRLYEEIRNGNGVGKGGTPVTEAAWPSNPSRKKWFGLVAATTVLAVVVAGAWFLTRPASAPPIRTQKIATLLGGLEFPDQPSIAVLPFLNLSEDPEQRHFADGMAEDILTELTRYENLFVIARSSSFQYRGRGVDVRQVSRELGVQYVLEGSLRKAEGRIRVTTQLIDATTGHHVWAERYDRPVKDFFSLQDEITEKIVLALDAKLLGGGRTLATRKATQNLEAYHYLRRMYDLFNQHTRESNAEAVRLGKLAIQLDPNFGSAYGKLGNLYQQRIYEQYGDREEALQNANNIHTQIVKLENKGLQGLVFLTLHNLFFTGKPENGLHYAKQIMLDYPSESESFVIYGMALFSEKNRLDEAISLFRRGVRLDPFPESWKVNQLAKAYYFSGRLKEAQQAYEFVVSVSPNFLPVRGALAGVYYETGQHDLARKHAAIVREQQPGYRLVKRLNWEKIWHAPYAAHLERMFRFSEKAGIPWD